MRLIATVLLVVLAAAGCGNQQSGTGVASIATGSARPSAATPTSTADPQEQGRKWAQCMREHGVQVDDPDPNGGGGLNVTAKKADKGKIQDAMEACRGTAPFMDRKASKPQDLDQLRAFATCMRDNGVDMPDPNPDGTFGTSAIDRNDAGFKKAFDACRGKFPKMGTGK